MTDSYFLNFPLIGMKSKTHPKLDKLNIKRIAKNGDGYYTVLNEKDFVNKQRIILFKNKYRIINFI
jgi:hypothetical protein